MSLVISGADNTARIHDLIIPLDDLYRIVPRAPRLNEGVIAMKYIGKDEPGGPYHANNLGAGRKNKSYEVWPEAETLLSMNHAIESQL